MEQLQICIDGNYVFISNGSTEQLDNRIGGMAIEISQLFRLKPHPTSPNRSSYPLIIDISFPVRDILKGLLNT